MTRAHTRAYGIIIHLAQKKALRRAGTPNVLQRSTFRFSNFRPISCTCL